MPKKPKQYPIGTAQTTGKKRIEFIHWVPKRKTPLYHKGLHGEIEAWMLEHPGEQLPKTYFEKKYNVSSTNILYIVKQIEQHHKLPARSRGGTHNVIAPEIRKVIETACSRTAKKKTKVMDLWELTKEIAKKTGKAVSPTTIQRNVEQLEEEKKEGVTVKRVNVPDKPSDIIKRLQEEGIEATTGKVYRTYHNL